MLDFMDSDMEGNHPYYSSTSEKHWGSSERKLLSNEHNILRIMYWLAASNTPCTVYWLAAFNSSSQGTN